MEDLEAVVATLNAYSSNQIGVEDDSVEALGSDWQSLGFQLSTDTLMILTRQGQVAGYSEFWERGEPYVRLIGWSGVHPQHWGRGLGKYLLEWSIERGRQTIQKAPEGAQVVLQHFAWSTNQDAARLFTAHGFQLVRSQYIMRIDFDRPPQSPTLPDGITIRPIAGGGANGEKEERAALFTAHQAFKDHWGNTNQSFEEYYRRYRRYIENNPYYDPALQFLALDGEDIAGVSLCSLHTDEDPDMAWVGTLGVLRPWRKRGIGLALLQHSFCEFYRSGKKRAGLQVDAGSLTGAVRLYERVGMRVLRKLDIYELELRPGKEIMKRTIEEPSRNEEK
jgi:ribosomal protein S18 acetylase RimI-like enzyme